ncbi:MAG: TetR/AcrR family transcriptional regulator [Acidimicrobiales bacterium]
MAEHEVAVRRRTQIERSAAMRARLLDAAVECLVERGYAGTTTTEVVRRAGVSRGAQVHHFPTKQALVLEAIEHVIDQRYDYFDRLFGAADASAGRRSLGSAIDVLWAMYQEPIFAAWLELAVAARTDPELRPQFERMERRFAERIEERFRLYFPDAEEAGFSRNAVSLAFAIIEGLALQRTVGIDNDAESILDMLKGLAALFSDQLGGNP